MSISQEIQQTMESESKLGQEAGRSSRVESEHRLEGTTKWSGIRIRQTLPVQELICGGSGGSADPDLTQAEIGSDGGLRPAWPSLGSQL